MSTPPSDDSSTYILGADEVGYGAWAGPLFVCTVAVPKTWKGPAGLTDSKTLTPGQRAALYFHLQHLPMALMAVESDTIDSLGVKKALLQAHGAAIRKMQETYPQADVVIDGVLRPPGLLMVRAVPHADAIFPAVSAASVIAKVNRDFVMRQYHEQFPYYGWKTNVGYGSKSHQKGLKEHGICPLHRKSYRPIKAILEATT